MIDNNSCYQVMEYHTQLRVQVRNALNQLVVQPKKTGRFRYKNNF